MNLLRIFSLILFCLLGSPMLIAGQIIDKIVAIVDEDIITLTELDRQMQVVQQQIRAQNTLPPPQNVLKKQVLEREIIKRIQLQLAKNTGITIDDNALTSTLENIAAQNSLSLDEFRKVLERDGFKFADFREDIRNEMALARLMQREVNSRVLVTDQEIANFISTQETQGNIDDEFLLSHILIAVPEASNAEAIEKIKDKAQRVLDELNQGADFAQMAISVSNAQKALEGGSLGWRKAGQLPALFTRLVFKMKKKSISELIRSPNGFHIIQLVDKRTRKKHIITQTQARHILMRPNELMDADEVVLRLQQLRERIINGDDFLELARSHSADTNSAAVGGDLGWISPGDMVPQFETVMNDTSTGEVSEPFQSQFGWHILQVLDRRSLDNREEFARNKANEFIRQRKTDELAESWLRQLRDQAYVQIKIQL